MRQWDAESRSRTIAGIRAIRAQKERDLPQRTLKNTLLLATWNIRDFGNEDKRAESGLNQPGPRLEESYFYIAEIISGFDLVAVQEVNSLEALEHLMRILGPSWEYMTTDVAPGKAGNEERMTFIYDKSKVRFKNVAGQIVTDAPRQLVRPPYYAAFQSGWFKFSLCTVHILYGDYRNTAKRIKEIDEIAGNLSDRVERTGENIILLGDFNILSRSDATFKPLDDHGWTVPLDHLSDISKTKAYDQIAFKIKEGELKLGPSSPNSGAFRMFDAVFPDDSWQDYYHIAEATGRPMQSWDETMNWPHNDRKLTRAEYFQQWRTWQMSDHLPLWVELEIDFTEDYLERILG
ncbi:endonuclease/exonuclease/phosphatase family protein [Blastomonas sp.]|uniref:endonuclease/exonuclease/phosphatase family protein n=1 Tax=Blastomonas sp. TaxID=1909299 RepID=UPI0035942E7E